MSVENKNKKKIKHHTHTTNEPKHHPSAKEQAVELVQES